MCHVRHSIERHAQGSRQGDNTELGATIDLPFEPVGGYPHQNSILAIWALPGSVDLVPDTFEECADGYQHAARYLTGDRDGTICMWRLMEARSGNPRLVLLKSFSLRDFKHPAKGSSIKSICERDGLILVATSSSEIFEIQDENVPVLKSKNESTTSMGSSASSRRFSVIPSGGAALDGKLSSAAIADPIFASRISEGHSSGEVWGLASHPYQSVYFTAGDDAMIKCWNLNPHRLLSFASLPEKARSIDINRKTLHLAASLNNGGILILNIEPFLNPNEKKTISVDPQLDAYDATEKLGLHLLKDADPKSVIAGGKPPLILAGSIQRMQVVKFSFDGSFLAGGSQDSKIYVYDVNQNYNPAVGSPFALHNTGSTVTHIDFGVSLKREIPDMPTTFIYEDFDREENKILQFEVQNGPTSHQSDIPVRETSIDVPLDRIVVQSCSNDGQLIFWNACDGSRVTSMSKVKDAYWAMQSSPYGWAVQGIWPVDSTTQNNNDILNVARSHSFDQVPVLAAVDIFGRVRLYNYPCVHSGAPDKCYRGHSSKVTNIAFSCDDNYLITTGGQDRCVFVWATDIQDEIRERSVFSSTNSNSKASKLNFLLLDDAEGANSLQNVNLVADEENFQISKVVPVGGDERGAVKPWKGAIREPTGWKEPETSEWEQPPSEHLDLAFVHGYRGWDCRNNLFYADTSDAIVYHVAALGIVLNTRSQSQVINHEHGDDILCLSVHPEGHVVATGEIGKFPNIVIWDANTGVTIRIIKGHKKGISHISFANMGKMLVSCGMDDDRTVMVHDTHSGTLLGKGKAGRGIDIYTLAMAVNGLVFATGGKNHVKFWELPTNPSCAGVELSSKTGIYNLKSVKARTICSATYLGMDAVTGMNDGSILLWKDRSNTKAISAHQGPVTAMTAITSGGSGQSGGNKFRSMDARESGPRILSGGKDGFIYMWDVQFNKIWSLNLNESTPPSGGPQIQSLSARNNRVLIGTKAAEIYECSMLGSTDLCRHVAGHFQERSEVWGLDSHPKLLQFVTAGDDMTVRLWDAKLFRLEHSITMESKCRAVAYHPDGSQIAVALYDGKLQVFSEDLKRVAAKVIVSSSWSQCLAYSPDGQILAVGCHDNVIYLLETKSYACLAKCKGHHSFITGVDFSVDGRVLQSVSGDYELLFWNARTGKQIPSPSDVRDVEWNTLTCTLGWSVQGIWPPDADGSDINTVDRSPNHKLLATGDDYHSVKLFRYPCYKERAPFKEYKGHAEHVLKVKFSADGRYLYSVGGLDKAILQFEIKE